MHIRRSVTCAALLALFVLPAKARQADEGKPQDQLVSLLAEGEEYATKMFDNRRALEKFEEAVRLAPNNYEVLWHLSRTYVDIGEHLPTKTDAEKQEQLAWYEKSLEYAERAVVVNPSGSMGLTRRAIANGRIALFRGVWESLDLVKKVKEDAEKAVAIDPTNNAAYYMLGRTHAKVSERPSIVRWPLGLGWASYEEAVKYYEKAIALRPDFIMYRLDAARAYVELEDFAQARQHLNAIASLTKQDEDDDQYRKEAQDLVTQLATD